MAAHLPVRIKAVSTTIHHHLDPKAVNLWRKWWIKVVLEVAELKALISR